MKTGYITTQEVARRLGISAEEVRRKCVAGHIPEAFQSIPGRGWWQIPEQWVDDILSAVQPTRRKRV